MGVHLDASPQGGISRLEVIEGPTGRRRRSRTERAQVAAESFLPGVRVADVARKHGTTRWQIYDWRKRLRDGRLSLPEQVAALPAFAEVMVEVPEAPSLGPSVQGCRCIEVEIAGIVIRAGADADEAHLARVIRAARSAAG
jgi:transposase